MILLPDKAPKKHGTHYVLLAGVNKQEGIPLAPTNGFSHVEETAGMGISTQPTAERWAKSAEALYLRIAQVEALLWEIIFNQSGRPYSRCSV